MDEIITKRVHISGLTPAITPKDLSDRLGSFGIVKSLDGLGALDALGQPRKFAYATLETTKGKLSRCMNLLSGVTWKGAKLRLGEAKPDFCERVSLEQEKLKRAAEEAADQLPKKRRRLPRGVQGVYATDMSLVTPENVQTRGGWRVTATGRLIRPIRTRPDHPLPEMLEPAKVEKARAQAKADKSKRGKKRARDPPTRARRRTIDPTKWGSTHVKGIFLENAAARMPSIHPATTRSVPAESESESEEGSVEEEEYADGQSLPNESSEDSDGTAAPVTSLPSHRRTPLIAKSPHPKPLLPAAAGELAEETSKALSLLRSLFGDKEEWGGEESVGSDVDEEDLRRAQDDMSRAQALEIQVTDASDDDGGAMQVDITTSEEWVPVKEVAPAQGRSLDKTKLKDLFAPREEESTCLLLLRLLCLKPLAAGFSLLGHLDLDLELEDDAPFDLSAPAPIAASAASLQSLQPGSAAAAQMPRVTALDTSKPLFFPSDNAASRRRGLDPTNWRTWFYRTDSADAIRQRWEDSKGELTAGWKRRHREAIKSRRRRGGGAGEVE
ncbi:hypothetical protein BC628DRAFT_916512 [Trametes gibbosa]|nr:hypothetical protein BC628DRAFT_916512 [Trametes gibbosa]